MSEVGMTLSNLSEENKYLRVVLWRMMQKHGAEVMGGNIDDQTYDEILSSNVYLDDNLNVKFSKNHKMEKA